jgi:TfoX/Sxy family transcriptional regulator of competence genes
MPSPQHEYLQSLLDESSASLPGVTYRRMFGCHAAFANGAVYGLIWKTGRIALKFPDPETRQTLLSMPGAEPWTAGTKTMREWVLVPESFHDDEDLLREWVQRAHAVAFASGALSEEEEKPVKPAKRPRTLRK